MATLKLILSKSQQQRKVGSNQSMIMLRYTHNKQSVLFSTFKNIDTNYWDATKQCAKKSFDTATTLNSYLRLFKQKVEDIVNQLLSDNQSPMPLVVKQKYNQLKLQNGSQTNALSFFDYAKQFIAQSKLHKTNATVKTYVTVINKLLQYQSYAKVSLCWHSFDMAFYYDFLHFYTNVQSLHTNGFGRAIKIIKIILNNALEHNIHNCTAYKSKKFKVLKEEVNNIYLSEDELQQMMQLDLSENPTMQLVRDCFIIACYTGLRFSDIAKVKSENISDNTLTIKTQKTLQWVNIPLLPIVVQILRRYQSTPNGFPTVCCSLTMNKYLKVIGQLANLNDNVILIRSKGKQRVEQCLPKYQLISTHTARRSFATNLFKKGVPSRVIMSITGHQTEQSFNSYIKINGNENAQLLLSYLNKLK